MNVFVLGTGRTGSVSFSEACKYMTNYTSGHEINISKTGEERMTFPDNHIEIDNRLSWMLGRLDKKYGDSAFYVHIKRETASLAESFSKRIASETGIINAYANEIVFSGRIYNSDYDICVDYINTVNENIELFLKDKSNKMEFHLEESKNDFRIFWKRIQAEGDLGGALKCWDTSYNEYDRWGYFRNSLIIKIKRKITSMRKMFL